MMSILKSLFVLTFLLFFLSVSAFACTCVRQKVKVRGFKGQIFAVRDQRPGEKEKIFESARLRLLKREGDEQKIIADIISGESGNFSLEGIKPGTYLLEVWAEHFQKVVTEIKITKALIGKHDELEIGLDPSVSDCCVGYFKVVKQ